MTTVQNEPIEVQLRLERPGFTLDVDVRLPGQGVSALFGPSGCGKTTCLRAVAGLERAPQGRVVVAGEVWQDEARKQWLPTHRRALGYVFQEASLFPHLSVRGNVEYGLRRLPAQRRRIPLEQALELLGLQALLARAPATLSGGERQRARLAQLAAQDAQTVLLDEPLTHLDPAHQAALLGWTRAEAARGRSVALTLHDPNWAAGHCDRLLFLYGDGRWQLGTPADLLTPTALEGLYGPGTAALWARGAPAQPV